ncbi:MAG: hypothetical protein PHR84_00555 [Candidatus Omnitrophica bacterium]|nr:hypothetical protein [Candidatus Omnitrophota bacterium]MDD5660780.1 hypothetical protein [Candidatus Omnitrophota bacterium]
MSKRTLLAIFLFVFILSASGCTVVKGIGGAACGLGKGVAEGFNDDANFIKKADRWTKDNLW